MSNHNGGLALGLLRTVLLKIALLRIISLMIVSLIPVVYADPLLTEAGRNPFQDISAASCDDDREKLTGWQLQGIVSGADNYSGWVQQSGGRWQKLVIGSRLLPNWQVTHISVRQVNLQQVTPDKSCSGISESVVLLMR
jgi:pilus assembly protein HofP